MEKEYFIIKIRQAKSDTYKQVFDGALELSVISIGASIFFMIKYGFNWIYFLIFIPAVLIFLLIGFILKYIPQKNYIDINTKDNTITIRKRNKIMKYDINDLNIYSKIITDDDNYFIYLLYFKYNNKKIFTINNQQFEEIKQRTKDFYNTLNKYLTIKEL